MQTTVGSHGLALVSPQFFSDRMHKHWSEDLNMPTPPALISVWRIMAEQFRYLITNNFTDDNYTPSLVLPLPTGSGKTEGTCVYAAMQAELNQATTTDNRKPVGIVIVTRLITDADRIAENINKLSGRGVAVAHHTKNKADATAILNNDVLVVTHQAFLNAAKSWGAHESERWERISLWKGGRRLLVIVDEALANVVEGNKVTVDNLATVMRSIPHEMRQQFPEAITTLETLNVFLTRKADQQTASADTAQTLWREGAQTIATQFRLLREAMSTVDFDTTLYREEAPKLIDATQLRYFAGPST